MTRFPLAAIFLLVLLVQPSSMAWAPGTREQPQAGQELISGSDANGLTAQPVYFTENRGQVAYDGVRFQCMGSVSAYFTDDGVIYRVWDRTGTEYRLFKMGFAGAGIVRPVGLSPLACQSNFFLGNDPARWVSGVPNYGSVLYRDLYPGIDLLFTGCRQGMKSEFVVRPGADLGDIRLSFEGAKVSIDGDTLVMSTPSGEVRDRGFCALQTISGREKAVPARMIVDGNTISYEASYDRRYELVLDPLVYSTFLTLGGTGAILSCFTVDADGFAYFSGSTGDASFPVTPGAYDTTHNGKDDIVVLKLNQSGTGLVYSTFIGGSDYDWPSNIAADPLGNLYVTGHIQSTDFPTTPGAFDTTADGNTDAYVLELSSDGSRLVYSTLIGGNWQEFSNGLAIDSNGSAYVVGTTGSTDFPTTPGAYDRTYSGYNIYVVKVSPDGSSLDYSTFLESTELDWAKGIAVDSTGCAYLTGYSNGGIPTTNGSYQPNITGGSDAFIVKLNPQGSDLVYSTFVGASASESGNWIALDPSGNAYIEGITDSPDFPVTPGAFDPHFKKDLNNVFLFKLDANGSSLVFSTFIGGKNETIGDQFAVDSNGSAYIGGFTNNSYFNTTPGAYDRSYNGEGDAFLLRLDPNGSPALYSTFIGGRLWDAASGVALDSSDCPYVFGSTASFDFPLTPGAFETVLPSSGWSYLAFKLLPLNLPSAPRNFTLTDGDGYVALRWSAPEKDGGYGLINYTLYRGKALGSMSPLSGLPIGTSSYNDTGVENGVTYYYRLTARTLVGEGDTTPTLEAIPGARPDAPWGVRASGSQDTVMVFWSPPNYTARLPVLTYSIYRANRPEMEKYLVNVGNVTSFKDTDVQNGVIYYYRVTANNTLGESAFSTEVLAIPTTAPSKPRNLTAVYDSSAEVVSLQWLPPDTDGGSRIDHFRVYRGQYPGLTFLDNTENYSYEDPAGAHGTVNYYAVSAVNSVYEGNRSAVVGVEVGSAPETPRNLTATAWDGKVNLNWTAPEDTGGFPILKYSIYRGDPAGMMRFLNETADTHFTDTDVINGITYFYRVSATTSIGEGRYVIASATPHRLPSKVGNITASQETASVLLQWAPPTDSGGGPVVGYGIYRSEGNGTSSLYSWVPTPCYLDERVMPGLLYRYKVAAITVFGEGEPSEEVSAGFPVANFSVVPGLGHVTTSFSFRSASFDPDGKIAAWDWDFGDGGRDTRENVTHRYSRPGTFTVRLTVRDGHNSTGSFSRGIAVLNRAPVILSAIPESQNISIKSGNDVAFQISASDEDGDNLSYRWYMDFEPVCENDSYNFKGVAEGAHHVKVAVSDGNEEVSREWVVDIPGKKAPGASTSQPLYLPVIIVSVAGIAGGLGGYLVTRGRHPREGTAAPPTEPLPPT